MRVFVFYTFVLSILISPPLFADQIYKSVDKEGNVTYSMTPLQDAAQVQPVDLPPGPSEQQVQEAKERADQTQQSVEEMSEQRRQRDQEVRDRREQARQEAKEETARTEEPDDRYYGYRRGYPIYPRPNLPHPPVPGPPAAVPLPAAPGGSL